jgi:feruloyl esterase
MRAYRRSSARGALLSSAFGAGLLASSVFAVAPAAAALPNCTASSLGIANLTVSSAVDVPVATNGEGAGPGSAAFVLKLPALWNDRFLFLGCGGNCGSLTNISANGVDVAEALGLGYAVVNTDTGHEQSPTTPDPTWVLLAPGVPNTPAITDFYYRAVHQVTAATKQYVQTYYGGRIRHAYFDGCSTGGRQSLMEGERYPDDFDGLIAGDAVMSLSYQRASSIKQAKAFLPPAAWLPYSVVAQVDAAVEANCDAADGVKDGLIQNPAMCSFDPQSLVPSVLTQAQADALRSYMKMETDPGGRPVFPGMPISDLGTAGFEGQDDFHTVAPDPTAAEPWGGPGIGPAAWTLGDAGIRYYIAYDPSYDVNNSWPQKGNIVPDATLALLRKRSGAADSDDPYKLDAFLDKGGKLIMYHGYSDHLVSSYRSLWFYKELATLQGGDRHLQDSARLFMVPGMGHCGGGPGPNAFDTLKALDNWVTNGAAPDAIAARSAASGRTMPLCKYPEEAEYTGSGNVNDAANWVCNPHDHRMRQVGEDGIAAGAVGAPEEYLHEAIGLGGR